MNTSYGTIESAEQAALALKRASDNLSGAISRASDALADLRTAVVAARTEGVLSIKDIAAAVGRERNWVDSVFALSGANPGGRQPRVKTSGDPEAVANSTHLLHRVAERHRSTAAEVGMLRKTRDDIVVGIYKSQLLGPGAIATWVGIDRNHVQRLVKRAGVPTLHRANVKNQHTAKHKAAPATADA